MYKSCTLLKILVNVLQSKYIFTVTYDKLYVKQSISRLSELFNLRVGDFLAELTINLWGIVQRIMHNTIHPVNMQKYPGGVDMFWVEIVLLCLRTPYMSYASGITRGGSLAPKSCIRAPISKSSSFFTL